MKQIKKLILILTILLLPLSLSSCWVRGSYNPGPFDEYTAGLFKTVVSDEMTINFLFEDPTRFGLEAHYEPRLPTPSSENALSLLMLNLYFGQMPSYNYDELNFDQQMTYLVVEELLDYVNDLKGSMHYLDSNYLGSYLGYQAQLPLLLAEYNFRDVQDIENYFVYMDLVPSTFESYVNYEIDKSNKGYGMPDFVIDKVVEQCETFIASVEEHFLIATFDERINHLPFLTSEQKQAYLLKNVEKVTGPLMAGYQYVKDNLPSVYGKSTNNLGLAHYDKGRDYYALKFKRVTGYDLAIPDAIDYINKVIANRYARILELSMTVPNLSELLNSVVLMEEDPLTQVLNFTEAINSHFPTTPIPEIMIKYIDPSMENNFSPAAYMVSPLDSFTKEFIYLNNKYMADDLNYLYTTLAHEGFPGHMYQNIYFKSLETNPLRKVLKCSGYVEGWATYAQMYSYKLIDANPNALEYLLLNDELNGALSARLDMGIHYEGWNVEEVQDFIKTFNPSFRLDAAQNLLERLVEVPTNAQTYFFTYFKFIDLYEKAKVELGSNFDPVLFHEAILNCGPIPMRFVEDVVNQYINKYVN